MKHIILVWSLLIGAIAGAEPPPTGASRSPTLNLAGYLEQVRSGNPEARAATQGLQASQWREDIAESSFATELYSEYRLFDNRQEQPVYVYPMETRGRVWKVGLRKESGIGLRADVYFNSTRNLLLGTNPMFPQMTDYEQSSLGINLSQSLLRNSFGASVRAAYEGRRAASRAEILDAKYKLKNVLLRAENTYWSLVSFNEILKLQTENVERAKRLRDHMKQRASMRLFDDVDAMQTEASFQQRELELQNSQNARAVLVRDFNTLRGQDGESVEVLADLPTNEFMLKTVKDPAKRMSREDFAAVYERAVQAEAMASGRISDTRPQLDLVGGISGNGLDRESPPAYSEATSGRHPNWNIGLVFSTPIDYRLIGHTRDSYRADRRAARELKEQARFAEERTWDDLLKRNREAQTIFEKSLTLERLQTDLVKRERQRLMNGRSTTLQTVSIEQNLALAQISRVQAQLSLLQIHNLMKQFEESP